MHEPSEAGQQPAPQPADAGVAGSSRLPRATVAVTSIAVFAVLLDTTLLFVAFPDITATFAEANPTHTAWVLNGFTIVFAALLVPAGRLADRRGHRRAFLVGVAVFGAGALACAIAPTLPALVASRVVQAAGAAVLLPSSLALLLGATPRRLVPLAVAFWGATGAAAAAAGPTVGALVVEAGGWRPVFLLHLPVVVIAIWFGRRVLVEVRHGTSRLPSPVGVVLLIAALVVVTLALLQVEQVGLTAILPLLLAGLLLLALLVVHQLRTAAPVIEPALFRIRNFSLANAAMLVFGVAFAAMFLASILFLTEVWEWSVLRAGLGVAPGPLLVLVLAPFVGRVAVRLGQRPLLITGGVLYALGGVWRVVLLDAEIAYLSDFFPSMVLTGVGVALCLPQLSSVVGQALPTDRFGVGVAVNQAIRQLGMTLGVALAVGLVAEPVQAVEAAGRFDRVWWLVVVGGLGLSLLSLPLRTSVAASSQRSTRPG